MIAVLAIVALIFGVSHYLMKGSTPKLFLGSNDARVASCTLPFPNISTTVDLKNPTGRTANLGTDVEFDDPRRSPERVGLVYVEADHVPGGRTIEVTQDDLPDGSVDEPSLDASHLTCKIVVPGSESSSRQ